MDVVPGFMMKGMMMKGMKGMGKGGPPGWQAQAQWNMAQEQWGIPGLKESLAEALVPVADEEPNADELIKKLEPKLRKVADRFSKDERVKEKATATQAKALIEECVDGLMGSISGSLYEKPWFNKVDFVPALKIAVLYAFSQAKIFTRTLAPSIGKHVAEGLYKWQEEERVTNGIREAVELLGITGATQKKACQH